MKNARKLFVFGAALFLLNAASFAQKVTGKFALVQEVGGELKTVNVTARPVSMTNNETLFRFYVSPNENCYVYIYYEPDGEFVGAMQCSAGKDYFFPSVDSDAFYMEPPAGLDKFHLVISRNEIPEFKKGKKEAEDKIAALKQEKSKLMEKPIKSALSGATSRAAKSTKVTEYTNYKSEKPYVKTITIQH